ncbi:MarR family transcriptional regulator [Oxalobacter aliiformigenes]|uniref:MarR family winged helix-turn-helix transcriptional regulator n=1 Tax=Oxalobacter aliiformigenes TaxID=2946593 RepID=UPI0022AFD442|nr:MarR family transcriptional regulator [Oxalobacter aliiformigenes]MCZ4064502.1 MarR family transcriptional regulator [Oxalobacter aliiformigenes]WAV99840.1 MarR family transcriptional regulator [Oxalobacter aliiformigenes]
MRFTNTLTRVARAYKTSADKVASQYGLSEATAWPAVMINQMGDSIRPGEVADALGLDPSSIVRVIDRLIAAELLTREEDANDRRARLLTLTENGRQRVKQVTEAMRPFRRKLFEDIDREDLMAALRVLEQLKKAINSDKASC